MSATDPTIANLQADLDAGPWLTLKAMADRLEELGQGELAEAYRWLAQQGKFPVTRRLRSTWSWRTPGTQTTDRLITLPGRVYAYIPSRGKHKGYRTVAAAFEVAALALVGSGWLEKAATGSLACKMCGRSRLPEELFLTGECDDCAEVRS